MSRRRPRAARSRGTALMVFVAIVLPLSGLAILMAIDITRLYLGAQEARAMARSAALAATQEIVDGTQQLDPDQAEREAHRVIDGSVAGHTAPHIVYDPLTSSVDADLASVTVRVRYQVPNLLVLDLFGPFHPKPASSVAEVCVPDGDRFCARPRHFD